MRLDLFIRKIECLINNVDNLLAEPKTIPSLFAVLYCHIKRSGSYEVMHT